MKTRLPALKTIGLATAALAVLSTAAPAHADPAPPAASPSPSPSPSPSDKGCTVLVQPVAWLPTSNVNLTFAVQRPLLAAALGGAISAQSTISPSQAVQGVNSAFSGRVEARNGPWGFSGELLYINVSQAANILNVGGTESAVTSIGQVNAFYRFIGAKPEDTVPVDFVVGARNFNFNLNVNFSSSFGFNLNPSTNFTDPIVGLRAGFPLSDHLRFTVYGDDGFGTITTNRYGGTFSYSFKNWDAVLGYLVMNFNRSDNQVQANLQLAGPTIGASLKF